MSTQFCSNLLEFIKEKVGRFHPTEHRIEHIKNCLDGQFFLESETKIRGFKHRIESLTKSLQKLSILLQAKSDPSSLSFGVNNALQLNSQYPEVNNFSLSLEMGHYSEHYSEHYSDITNHRVDFVYYAGTFNSFGWFKI